MPSLIRYLASFRFAVLLIFLALVFVVVGTFLESKTASHAVAEDWIYKSPLFKLLLSGFFVNILLSALSRWPFKNRHFPFLITHLGLLMIISGVFIKSVYGLQGHMQLIEGTASSDLSLDHEEAILVETPFRKTFVRLDQFSILEKHPHAVEKYTGWSQFDFDKPVEICHTLDKNILLKNEPCVGVLKDQGSVTIGAFDLEGSLASVNFLEDHLKEWVAYNGGFQGYALQATLPFVTKDERRLFEQKRAQILIDELSTYLETKGPLSPPLELLYASDSEFPKSLIPYLQDWSLQGTWLNSSPYPKNIVWNEVPKETFKALYWIAVLFEEDDFLQNLKERNWPLLKPLENLPEEDAKKVWMGQLFSVRDQLGPPSELIDKTTYAKMLSAYFRLYEIHYDAIPKPKIEDAANVVTLETPLERRIEKMESPLKKEDATPFVLIDFNKEQIPLVFDKTGTQLKRPTKDGRFLLSYQPLRLSLPYLVRLHKASDIKHLDTNSTASFECNLTLTNLMTKEVTPFLLRMNQVYETSEGFRFYLAGMGAIDPLGVKSVQLVLNYDPAKWWLTYPGAILVALGIVLLFWRSKKS